MAPIRFPINDWDGDGSTDSLFDITMEMKVCESFQKEETDFLDELIPELPLNLNTDDYDTDIDHDYEVPDSENTVEVIKTADIYPIIWTVLRSVFKEYI